MKKKIKKAIERLRLLNDNKEIGGNVLLWSFIKFFTGHQRVKQAAAALTYHTLFAIVPVMALMVAVAKVMGYGEAFSAQIVAFLPGQEGVADELLSFAERYLKNAGSAYWLGAVFGLILLIYSLFSILQTIDGSFNSLWNLKEHSLKKQAKTFLILLSVPFAAILLLAAWLSISSYFDGGFMRDANIFVLTTCIFISVLFIAYKFIPNTKVNTRHAALSAVFCGFVFAVMQYCGSLIFNLFSSYHNIYGDLANVLLFILWIYFSWTICLTGSRWNYLLHEGDRLDAENRFKGMSYNGRKFLTLLAIIKCRELSKENKKHLFSIRDAAAKISSNYSIPMNVTDNILDTMERKGIIKEKGEDKYLLKESYRLKESNEIIEMLDNEGRHSINELALQLGNEEKAMWQKIEKSTREEK